MKFQNLKEKVEVCNIVIGFDKKENPPSSPPVGAPARPRFLGKNSLKFSGVFLMIGTREAIKSFFDPSDPLHIKTKYWARNCYFPWVALNWVKKNYVHLPSVGKQTAN